MTDHSCAPVLIERVCGGWLALAPDATNIRIGTTGSTREEAAVRLTDALRQCLLATENARSDPAGGRQ